MKPPVLKLQFIPNAYTRKEKPMQTVASFTLVPVPEHAGLWSMPKRELVTFPTGDTLEVYAEVTSTVNHVHIYHQTKRWISWKAGSNVTLMFVLPSSEEAYVQLDVYSAVL